MELTREIADLYSLLELSMNTTMEKISNLDFLSMSTILSSEYVLEYEFVLEKVL